jgi:hypothetical protein
MSIRLGKRQQPEASASSSSSSSDVDEKEKPLSGSGKRKRKKAKQRWDGVVYEDEWEEVYNKQTNLYERRKKKIAVQREIVVEAYHCRPDEVEDHMDLDEGDERIGEGGGGGDEEASMSFTTRTFHADDDDPLDDTAVVNQIHQIVGSEKDAKLGRRAALKRAAESREQENPDRVKQRKAMTFDDRQRQDCIDYLERQNEILRQQLELLDLVDREKSYNMLRSGKVQMNEKRAKFEAMQRALGFADRCTKLAERFLKSKTPDGEHPGLDAAQVDIVRNASMAVAPKLFGTMWGQCEKDYLSIIDVRELIRLLAVLLPRQFGKTLIVSLIAAQLLFDCPEIAIVVFSVNQTSSNRLLEHVKACLDVLLVSEDGKVNNRSWITESSAKGLSILQPDQRQCAQRGKARSMQRCNTIKAVPSNVNGKE